ncbi:Peptidase family S51 [Legionella gratiana]|uniref:Peptidase E n=1 Tax=Legionella gratiana TaxID=45066 RepID=A0A378JG75_9GAMM|nr:Type 1 glutamine amidotransferase-like domain-containing protein [Legionella gratiana]KTD12040.1 Peptidase family S51 [Legionella gratiana]STX46356.1 Peptidase E [Legionella gratiana]
MSHMLLMSFDDSNFMKLNHTLNRFMEYAFSLIKKSNVRFCYIGTASNDRLIERIFFTRFVRAKFGKKVITSELILTKSQLTKEQLENYLTQQDVLFVGGGNTEKMLKTWEKSGFNFVLNKLKSEKRLPILAGVSAGGMYPFHSGLSDSTFGQYKALLCLGWFKESFCPHANSKIKSLCIYSDNQYLERMDAYINAVKQGILPAGFAVPDDCMLHFENFNLVRVISSLKDNKCYYVTHEKVTDLDTTYAVNTIDPNIRLECWKKLFKCIDYLKQCTAKLYMDKA